MARKVKFDGIWMDLAINNCLKRKGIDTLPQIYAIAQGKDKVFPALRAIKGMGPSKIALLKENLTEAGLPDLDCPVDNVNSTRPDVSIKDKFVLLEHYYNQTDVDKQRTILAMLDSIIDLIK